MCVSDGTCHILGLEHDVISEGANFSAVKFRIADLMNYILIYIRVVFVKKLTGEL